MTGLLLALTLSSGCVCGWLCPRKPYTYDPVPSIGEVEKPLLDMTYWKEKRAKGELTKDEMDLILKLYQQRYYSDIRDRQIAEYNKFAKRQNEKYAAQKKELDDGLE